MQKKGRPEPLLTAKQDADCTKNKTFTEAPTSTSPSAVKAREQPFGTPPKSPEYNAAMNSEQTA